MPGEIAHQYVDDVRLESEAALCHVPCYSNYRTPCASGPTDMISRSRQHEEAAMITKLNFASVPTRDQDRALKFGPSRWGSK